jgi:hypothetical protein
VAVILYFFSIYSCIFTILIPFHNLFFVVTVHTFFIHTPMLMSIPVSTLSVGNYGHHAVTFVYRRHTYTLN